MHTLIALLALLFGFESSPTAPAQLAGGPEPELASLTPLAPGSLLGTYRMTKLDGTPIFPDTVTDLKVLAGPFPCLIGIVCVDSGQGPKPVDAMLICPVKDGYSTLNKAGNQGKITPKGGGVYETEMKTGPNKGKKRKMVKLP